MPFIKMDYKHVAEEVYYGKNPLPYAYHTLCNMSGEDKNCANKYKTWSIKDHNTYMGYNFVKSMTQCNKF